MRRSPGGPAPRHDFPDVVRATAILMVVTLHVAATVVVQFGRIPGHAWWVANLADAAVRPAVPLFVMVSGMLLLDPGRPEGDLRFLGNRARRVLWPFAAWVGLYFAWRATYHGEALSAGQVVREALRGPVYPHLWFLYMIVGLYLLTPVLRPLARHASRASQGYLVAVCLAVTSVLPLLRRWGGLELGVHVGAGAVFGAYFMLGHLLRAGRLTGGPRRAARAALLLLVALTAAGTYGLSARAGGLDASLYDYHAPNVVLMSVLWFLLLQPVEGAPRPGPRLTAALGWLAGASFGIYLVHPVFQELYQGGRLGVSLHGLTVHPVLGVPLAAAVIVATSAAAIVLFRHAVRTASSLAARAARSHVTSPGCRARTS